MIVGTYWWISCDAWLQVCSFSQGPTCFQVEVFSFLVVCV